MEYLTFYANSEDIGKRIDLFLAEEIDDLSRSRIQKLAENKNILVNSKEINKNYKLKLNDYVEVNLPEPETVAIKAENIPLDILYEDEDIIVVNKPQGMVVHPAVGHYDGTLVNALMFHCKNLSGINGELRPGIVHRIDRDTSGVLVVAKNDNAHKFLAEQLAVHSMTRVYHAITQNKMSKDSGTINKPIGRHNIERKKMAITEKNSKHAVTHFKVIEQFDKHSLLELKLETGRTHQIRVHMASIGHPILGDMVYGAKKQPFDLKGQALHAKVLGFIHPKTKEYLEFEAPYPEYFEKLIKKLRK